jgi:glycosyltransferase involved in cell wall biosynthesis
MQFNPLVSVVMSVYNGERYLSKAIESILNQTYPNIEFIIINDGSTDRSSEIISSFSGEKIILVERENRGLIDSLNEGFALAKGDYIARQDADDVSIESRIHTQVEFLEKNLSVYLVGANAEKIDENDNVIGTITNPSMVLPNFFYHANPFVHGSIMLRRKLLDELHVWYDKKMLYIEDYDFFWRMSVLHDTMNIQENLYLYREHNESISAKKVERQVINVYLRRLLESGKIPEFSETELAIKQRCAMMAKVENNIGHRLLMDNEWRKGSVVYLKSAFKYMSVKSMCFFLLSLLSPRMLLKIISTKKE